MFSNQRGESSLGLFGLRESETRRERERDEIPRDVCTRVVREIALSVAKSQPTNARTIALAHSQLHRLKLSARHGASHGVRVTYSPDMQPSLACYYCVEKRYRVL
jgi:hypothetical protein